MWDILSPSRSEPVLPVRHKVEPGAYQEELVLPQIPTTERAETKDTIERPIKVSAYGSNRVIRHESESNVPTRIKDLESLVIDTREQCDKKIRRFIEEFSVKLKREMVSIKSRDQNMWKEVDTRTTTLFESLDVTKRAYENLTTSLTGRISNLQTKSTEAEIRLVALEKEIQRVANISATKTIESPLISPEDNGPLLGEIRLLKDQMKEDRRRYEAQLNELFRNFSDMEGKTRLQMNGINQVIQRLDRKSVV